MTMGSGFTNVGSTAFALQSAGSTTKGLGLGLAHDSTSVGSMVGPLLVGVLVQRLGYEWGFLAMALISLAVFLAVRHGLSVLKVRLPSEG